MGWIPADTLFLIILFIIHLLLIESSLFVCQVIKEPRVNENIECAQKTPDTVVGNVQYFVPIRESASEHKQCYVDIVDNVLIHFHVGESVKNDSLLYHCFFAKTIHV